MTGLRPFMDHEVSKSLTMSASHRLNPALTSAKALRFAFVLIAGSLVTGCVTDDMATLEPKGDRPQVAAQTPIDSEAAQTDLLRETAARDEDLVPVPDNSNIQLLTAYAADTNQADQLAANPQQDQSSTILAAGISANNALANQPKRVQTRSIFASNHAADQSGTSSSGLFSRLFRSDRQARTSAFNASTTQTDGNVTSTKPLTINNIAPEGHTNKDQRAQQSQLAASILPAGNAPIKANAPSAPSAPSARTNRNARGEINRAEQITTASATPLPQRKNGLMQTDNAKSRGFLANLFGGRAKDEDLSAKSRAGQPIEVASLSGLARLSPSALIKQTEKVRVDCFKPSLMRLLKKVEDHYDKPVIVTSGYRSDRENRRIGGASGSRHTTCEAADVQIKGVSKWELAKFVRSLPDRGGVGTYCHTKSVHIDVGSVRDWNWRCRKRK